MQRHRRAPVTAHLLLLARSGQLTRAAVAPGGGHLHNQRLGEMVEAEVNACCLLCTMLRLMYGPARPNCTMPCVNNAPVSEALQLNAQAVATKCRWLLAPTRCTSMQATSTWQNRFLRGPSRLQLVSRGQCWNCGLAERGALLLASPPQAQLPRCVRPLLLLPFPCS